jgi:hypothetical protein
MLGWEEFDRVLFILEILFQDLPRWTEEVQMKRLDPASTD